MPPSNGGLPPRRARRQASRRDLEDLFAAIPRRRLRRLWQLAGDCAERALEDNAKDTYVNAMGVEVDISARSRASTLKETLEGLAIIAKLQADADAKAEAARKLIEATMPGAQTAPVIKIVLAADETAEPSQNTTEVGVVVDRKDDE